jgi:hypothetical protein
MREKSNNLQSTKDAYHISYHVCIHSLPRAISRVLPSFLPSCVDLGLDRRGRWTFLFPLLLPLSSLFLVVVVGGGRIKATAAVAIESGIPRTHAPLHGRHI